MNGPGDTPCVCSCACQRVPSHTAVPYCHAITPWHRIDDSQPVCNGKCVSILGRLGEGVCGGWVVLEGWQGRDCKWGRGEEEEEDGVVWWGGVVWVGARGGGA